jgi:hypothetical protein
MPGTTRKVYTAEGQMQGARVLLADSSLPLKLQFHTDGTDKNGQTIIRVSYLSTIPHENNEVSPHCSVLSGLSAEYICFFQSEKSHHDLQPVC